MARLVAPIEYPPQPDEMSDHELEAAEECAARLIADRYQNYGLTIWQCGKDFGVDHHKLARHLQWRSTCRKLKKKGG